ncbi:hypothetical protein RvY_00468 [Ramazzottius varieornatus]|uniref:Uncharacterized protein n=1 Tax=Ramazzottius varieornatus TaxID=947166 RepID=A0A1D1UJ63_RAMVA|nr:hypothetical protein RvY_00468 [Ramazzottius varieornatus]
MNAKLSDAMRFDAVFLFTFGIIGVALIHALDIRPFDQFGDDVISAAGYTCPAACTSTRSCRPGCACFLPDIACAGGAVCTTFPGGSRQLFCLCPGGTRQVGSSCVTNGTVTPSTTPATTKAPTCSGSFFQRCFPRNRYHCYKCKRQSFCELTSPENSCPCQSRKRRICFIIKIRSGAAALWSSQNKRQVGSTSAVTIDNLPVVIRQCSQTSRPQGSETSKLNLRIEFEPGVDVRSCTTKLRETFLFISERALKTRNFCTAKDFLYNNRENHISTRSFVGVKVKESLGRGQFYLTRPGPPEGPKGGFLVQRYSVYCTNTDSERSNAEDFYVAFPSCRSCRFQRRDDNCPDAKRHPRRAGNGCRDDGLRLGGSDDDTSAAITPCLPFFGCTPDPNDIITLSDEPRDGPIQSADFEDFDNEPSGDDQLDDSASDDAQSRKAEVSLVTTTEQSSQAEEDSATSQLGAADTDEDSEDTAADADAASTASQAFAESNKFESSDNGAEVSGSVKSQSSFEESSSSEDK